jgi:hypothetical protein
MRFPRSPVTVSIALALPLSLAACGGGGGGANGGATPGPVTPAVPAVPANQAPQLTSPRFDVDEDQSLSGQLTATDPEGQSISFAKATDPAQGTASVTASGALTYVPPANFNGNATFDVTLTDAGGAQRTATVTVAVRPVNDAPVARDDQLRVATGAPVTLSLLANDTDVDGDTLNVTILTQGRGGAVSVGAGNVVTLTPDGSYSGPLVFTYRVTDAAGITADATARLVVGRFAGIVFVADETTPGTSELHHYDGFRTARLNAPLAQGSTLGSFAISGDGRRAAYVSLGQTFDRIFVVDLASPGAAREVYTTVGKSPNFISIPDLRLNGSGSRLLVRDPARPPGSSWVVVDTAGGTSARPIGTGNGEIVQMPGAQFGADDGEDLWVQAQVGGQPPPMSGSGYTTVYRGSSTAPATLQRVGAVYPANASQGSGINARLTRDGARLVHVSFVQQPNSSQFWDLLVIDRATGAENPLFRTFQAFEFPSPQEFALNAAGDAACFRLNEAGASSSTGPGRVYVANPAAPGSATAVSAVASYNFGCDWAADGRRLAFLSRSVGGAPLQWRIVDRTAPLAVSTLNATPPAGEELAIVTLSRQRPRGYYTTTPSTGNRQSLWRVDLDQPGQATRFFTDWENGLPFEASRLTLNPEGTMLAYRRGSPAARLFLVSTEATQYEFPITRSDATRGVTLISWLPET